MCRLPRVDVECFVSSSKDTPIRLWNVYNDDVSVYKSVDRMDELMSALSVGVSMDGNRLYGGYKG